MWKPDVPVGSTLIQIKSKEGSWDVTSRAFSKQVSAVESPEEGLISLESYFPYGK